MNKKNCNGKGRRVNPEGGQPGDPRTEAPSTRAAAGAMHRVGETRNFTASKQTFFIINILAFAVNKAVMQIWKK